MAEYISSGTQAGTSSPATALHESDPPDRGQVGGPGETPPSGPGHDNLLVRVAAGSAPWSARKCTPKVWEVYADDTVTREFKSFTPGKGETKDEPKKDN